MNDLLDTINHGSDGKGGTGAVTTEVRQVQAAPHETPVLANLISQVARSSNLKRAFKSVKRNKGAPGIDNISVMDVADHLDDHIETLQQQLLSGSYKPAPARGVEIEKPSGGLRQLAIPNVVDRWVAQAILQVLNPILDPTFSESSFGFRPKRSAGQAIAQARQFVADGREWVVDIDLENFFDNVNRDKLMSLLAKRIQDKALLKLIRAFLSAGVMHNGVCRETGQGTQQGNPLSPALSNIMLHELDKELERRGHKFCRYADDCNIYLHSEVAAKRVLKSISQFIEKRLKLKVNQTKSAVDKVNKRQFLGFTLRKFGDVAISHDSIRRFKNKVRRITKRNRGMSLERIITELNRVMRGWYHYFKCSSFHTIFKQLDCWIRRRLRCFRLKQRKRKYSIKTFLQAQGVTHHECWALAGSDKGWWRKALNPVAHQALNKQWFEGKGLFFLYENFVQHQAETAVCDNARTVV